VCEYVDYLLKLDCRRGAEVLCTISRVMWFFLGVEMIQSFDGFEEG